MTAQWTMQIESRVCQWTMKGRTEEIGAATCTAEGKRDGAGEVAQAGTTS